MNEFLQRDVPGIGKHVHRLGLACNYGIDAKGFSAGLERGLNYVMYTSMRTGKVRSAVAEGLKKNREGLVLASGTTLGYFGGSVRRGVESVLKTLGTDYIDVFHLFWVGVGAAYSDATREAMVKLKEEGKIRRFGISIHDRPRAATLAQDEALDLLMIRYNAAHPGAERDIFPHLPAKEAGDRRTAVVAYTATSWKKLIKRPSSWEEPVPTAADCYRFCLSSPHVDVVLTGPSSEKELEENIEGVGRGPLSAEEDAFMRRFGDRVK